MIFIVTLAEHKIYGAMGKYKIMFSKETLYMVYNLNFLFNLYNFNGNFIVLLNELRYVLCKSSIKDNFLMLKKRFVVRKIAAVKEEFNEIVN